jgi:hypothetical protein
MPCNVPEARDRVPASTGLQIARVMRCVLICVAQSRSEELIWSRAIVPWNVNERLFFARLETRELD